jgi:hypothetical protein
MNQVKNVYSAGETQWLSSYGKFWRRWRLHDNYSSIAARRRVRLFRFTSRLGCAKRSLLDEEKCHIRGLIYVVPME